MKFHPDRRTRFSRRGEGRSLQEEVSISRVPNSRILSYLLVAKTFPLKMKMAAGKKNLNWEVGHLTPRFSPVPPPA